MDSIRFYLRKGQVSHVNYILLIMTQDRNGWSFLRQNHFESWFEEWSPNSQIQLAITQLFNLAKIICVWLLWCFSLYFQHNWELISKKWSWTVNWSTTPCPQHCKPHLLHSIKSQPIAAVNRLLRYLNCLYCLLRLLGSPYPSPLTSDVTGFSWVPYSISKVDKILASPPSFSLSYGIDCGQEDSVSILLVPLYPMAGAKGVAQETCSVISGLGQGIPIWLLDLGGFRYRSVGQLIGQLVG